MKYIRTKGERIIDTTKLPNLDINSCGDITWYDNAERFGYMIKYDDILKQADTIEELCDAFIDTSELETTNTGGWLYDEFDSKNKCLVYYAEDERRTIPLNEFDELSKIYGAIFTDKGLIYVARMNEKGELELL